MSARDIIRREAAARGCRYRITRDGEVHMYGQMPGSIVTGWWLFAQSVNEAVAQIEQDSD